MKLKIGKDIWEIMESGDLFFIYKNGHQYQTQCSDGHVFETMSGACYGILNEFSID